MKSRKTTFVERLEINKWVIDNTMNYKKAADKYGIRYALIYQWVKKYERQVYRRLSIESRVLNPKVLLMKAL